MPTDYSEYLDTAVDAAREAAAILTSNFEADYDVSYKRETDLVSEVDLASERAIRAHLEEQYPDHAFFGEESGRSGDSAYTWIVDPLDGTTNYVNGFEHYCVTIALTIDGEPVVGVVHHPARDDVYTATRGGGAYRNGDPIAVSDAESLPESNVLLGVSPPIAGDEQFLNTFRRLIEAGQTRGVRRLGAGACDLSFVAAGRFDGFIDKYTSPWDVAAGVLLVSEAGGRVTDFGGDPVDLRVDEREVHLVASNGAIHDELLGIYEEAGTGEFPE